MAPPMKIPVFKTHPKRYSNKRPKRCPVCGSERISTWLLNYKYIYPANDNCEYHNGHDVYDIGDSFTWFRCGACNNRCGHRRDTMFDAYGNTLCVDSSFQLRLKHIDITGE